jgi:preprotein translocase subunit SecG
MGALLLVKWTVDVSAVYKLTQFVNQCNICVGGVQRRSGDDWLHSRVVFTFLAVIQVIISGILIFLILLHSGKDAGLSGAFGIGGGGSSFGGGSMVERNLDRATVFFAILFVVNTLVLLKI